MKDIRIGNDIKLRWTILTNGEPIALEGRDLALELWNQYETQAIEDFTVDDNDVFWTFRGKDQRYTGEYIITLYENRGQNRMAALDERAFRLVPRLFGTNGLEEPENVELTATLYIGANVDIDVATEEKDGLMPHEDKRLVNQYRQALEELTDEEINSWFNE